MADLSISAASVGRGGATTEIQQNCQFGEAMTQGQPAYLSTDNKWYKADADTSAASMAKGIVMTPASTSGYGDIALSGPVAIGATVTVGQVYVVSTTAGGIAPYSDLGTGDYVTILGVADTTSTIKLSINATGIAKA
jgi:hypothetical protein